MQILHYIKLKLNVQLLNYNLLINHLNAILDYQN
jgi:hypothetical protein